MIDLEFMKYCVHLNVLDETVLQPFNGATIRGAFGYTLKNIICMHSAYHKRHCETCLIYSSCMYTQIFETPTRLGSGKTLLVTDFAPHPFVFEPPLTNRPVKYAPGDEIRLNLIIIGNPKLLLPYFIHTLEYMGENGLGFARGKFTLKSVSITRDDKTTTIYEQHTKTLRADYQVCNVTDFEKCRYGLEKVELELKTPVRIKHNGRLQQDLQFQVFFKNLVRRLTTLGDFHGKNSLSAARIRAIIDLAGGIKTARQDTTWFDYRRFSTRQKQNMRLGGLIGKIVYAGDLDQFYPLLKAGEYLHVGKNTSFGFGQYAINNLPKG